MFVFLVILATIISIMGRFSVTSTHLRQRGDTIVEVLISVIIIATILSGAFVVAQASSHNVRSSQEHGYALQQIQGQVEAIRSLASAQDDTLNNTYGQGDTFCTYVDDASQTLKFVSSGNSKCAGGDSLYTVTVTKGAKAVDTAALTTFTVDVKWDKLGGGTNHESLVYGVKLNP
jgi:Tfp pilus assembly protein PilV